MLHYRVVFQASKSKAKTDIAQEMDCGFHQKWIETTSYLIFRVFSYAHKVSKKKIE